MNININKEFTLLFGILIVCLYMIISFNKKIIKPTYNLVIISLISIILLIFLIKNMKEKFKNLNEDVFTGIKGKTTMANLQGMQNKEIQNLEAHTKFIKSFLYNKNKEIDNKKYRKIPIKNSCIILNSQGTNNISDTIQNLGQDSRLINTNNLSKNEMNQVINTINS